MPPSRDKVLLRCAIPKALYEQIIREAEVQRIDVGVVVTGRLEQNLSIPAENSDVLLQRLDLIQQRQDQLLDLLEALVQHLAPTQTQHTTNDETLPIATYEQMYSEPPHDAVQRKTSMPPSPTKKGWFR
jgi:hypothetical protein